MGEEWSIPAFGRSDAMLNLLPSKARDTRCQQCTKFVLDVCAEVEDAGELLIDHVQDIRQRAVNFCVVKAYCEDSEIMERDAVQYPHAINTGIFYQTQASKRKI